MSSRLELSPAQLDRLEDALEHLELEPPPSDEDDAVAQRLSEFRELLQLSREAMPMQEVPAGLLDGVLAEARQAAAVAPAVPERRSVWSRWRLGVWLPALGFAGSAALLLVVLLPEGADRAPSTAAMADEAPEAPASAPDQRLADAERLGRSGSRVRLGMSDDEDPLAAGVARGEGLAIGERGPAPAAEAAPEPEPQEESAADGLAKDDADRSSRRASAPSRNEPAKPKPRPAPPPAPVTKSSAGGGVSKSKGGGSQPTGKKQADEARDVPGEPAIDLWPEVAEGDALRRQGNCGLAKMRYRNARKAEDSRVRARALAGEGLCEYADGQLGKAKKLFAQARAADAGVDAFIDGELSRLDEDQAVAADEDEAPLGE